MKDGSEPQEPGERLRMAVRRENRQCEWPNGREAEIRGQGVMDEDWGGAGWRGWEGGKIDKKGERGSKGGEKVLPDLLRFSSIFSFGSGEEVSSQGRISGVTV